VIKRFRFDGICGTWWKRVVHTDGATTVRCSAAHSLCLALDSGQ